jgi:hypothetical protein
MHTYFESTHSPSIVEKKIEICKQEVQMPPSLLFLDEDLGSLHFLFTIFYFFLNYALVLSISKLIAC